MYCDDVRLCCVHEMLEFLPGAPYAVCVELKNFYLCVFLGLVCFVCGSVWVWGYEELGWLLLGATYGSLCDGNMWGELGCVGCIWSRV